MLCIVLTHANDKDSRRLPAYPVYLSPFPLRWNVTRCCRYVMKNPTTKFNDFAYSIVHVHCLSNLSHIHEIGHNLGANHDIDSSVETHEYAHAERYCFGDEP